MTVLIPTPGNKYKKSHNILLFGQPLNLAQDSLLNIHVKGPSGARVLRNGLGTILYQSHCLKTSPTAKTNCINMRICRFQNVLF